MKKMLRVFLIVFTLLFVNLLSINVSSIKAEEPENNLDLTNAYRGEIENYWALVNYGNSFVGSNNVTIFLDPEAIGNPDVKYIMITEYNEYGDLESMYYERGIDSGFASRFIYTFVTDNYGEKEFTIFLLSDLYNIPFSIVDRIDVKNIEKLRTIEELNRVDFDIYGDGYDIDARGDDVEWTNSPYKVYIDINNNSCDYKLKNVTYSYTHINADGSERIVTGSAIKDVSSGDCNKFYFMVNENATYTIQVEDYFDVSKPNPGETWQIEIVNFLDTTIELVVDYDDRLTNGSVILNVEVYDGRGQPYPSNLINELTVTDSNGNVHHIENIYLFEALENGVYRIDCKTNPDEVFTEINITNIDKIRPVVFMAGEINIVSSSVENMPYSFDPESYVLATDNMTSGDDIRKVMNYYKLPEGGTCALVDESYRVLGSLYSYLYSVNDVCVVVEVFDEAGNNAFASSLITVIDDTRPNISSNVPGIELEIGDDMPTDEELVDLFGINTSDNSQINNPERIVTVVGDLSNVNLEELGVYSAYIYCYDEAGNISITLSLTVVVTRRILVVEVVPNQYIVYGEEMKVIEYTCNGNPCINVDDPDESEILPQDWNKLTGELYISTGSVYAGQYPIFSTLTINSNKYYLDIRDLGVFTIKPRTFKIIANSYSIDYKDSEPILTWYMDTSVCNPDLSTKYTSFNEMNYSCTFVSGDSFSDNTYVYRMINGKPLYAGGITREVGTVVKYSSGEVTYYQITKGDLAVKEFNSGGQSNYEIDFYGRNDILTVVEPEDWYTDYDKYYYLNGSGEYVVVPSPRMWEENKYFAPDPKTGLSIGSATPTYAKFYIYPKYVEVTITNVNKIYGEDDPSINYVDENRGAIKEDGKGHVQYEFVCFSYKEPIKSLCNHSSPNYSLSALQEELGMTISRENGENVGSYKIIGSYTNDNYEVFFNEESSPEYNRAPAAPAYLSILKRNIEMSIVGEDGSGKYTIFYEDALPTVTVRIDSDPAILHEGLASNSYTNINGGGIINFADRLDYGAHRVSYYDGLNKMEVVIGGYEEYITGVGVFTIKKDTLTIRNILEEDMWGNYNVNFHEGTLEVLARQIYIKVVEGLEKTYGENDPTYDNNYIVNKYGANTNHVVDGSGHYILQLINTLDNTTIVDRPDYEPFDKDKLVYFLKRSKDSLNVDEGDVHEGEMVGEYLISEDHYVNSTNYIIDILTDYYFKITPRNIHVLIHDASIEFNYDNLVPKFSYEFDELVFGDTLIGQPTVATATGFRNNGRYDIVLGNITPISASPTISDDGEYWLINGSSTGIKLNELDVLDKSLLRIVSDKYSVYHASDNTYTDTDVDFKEYSVEDNYVISFNAGTLTVVPREVVIVPDSGLSKVYAENDPKFTHTVIHYNNYVNNNYILEVIRDPSDFIGELSREEGEKPGEYFITEGDLRPAIKVGPNSPYDSNFIIKDFDSAVTFKIEKRTLVIRHAASDATNRVEVFYGDSALSSIVSGFSIVSGSEGINTDLCTMEVIGGVTTCDLIYDKIAGGIATDPANAENVGTYRIVNKDLHLERVVSGINVTDYYNLTFIEATLVILPRVIYITPHEGQTKIYGEGGGDNCDITYDFAPHLIKPTDTFSGCLKREAKLNPEGELTSEEVGEYQITLGNLVIGPNYKLVMNSSVRYQILPRNITITAKVMGDDVTKSGNLNVYTMMYGNEYTLGYDISGMGLVNNTDLGIHDTMINNVSLSPNYHGVDTYLVVRGSLGVANNKGRNYNITFERATFVVTKRVINVQPIALSKVYGEANPLEYPFILTNEVAPYTGELSRLPGENAGKYRIVQGSLNFGDNYEVVIEEVYFEILKREVIVTAHDKEKLFSYEDPELTYSVEVQDDFELDTPWVGKLERDPGEDVGVYNIIQGELDLNPNYNITYIGATLTISYARFEYIVINNITQNQYQTQGDERPVKLEARFNKGADETNLRNVTWTIVKDGKNVAFEKDISNVITFTPSGTAGIYVVTASYNGVSATYEVYVLPNNVSNIHISFFEGEDEQKLGVESEVVYKADIELLNDDYTNVTIEWFVGNTRVCYAPVTSPTNYCRFTPNTDVEMKIGTYTVYAVIGNVNSNTLLFKLNDNMAPTITLEKQGEIYYIEAFQNATENSIEYHEPGFKARDDVDGDITINVKIVGDDDINYYKTGKYVIIYTVTDSHGHVASNYRTVVVRDTVKPVITLNNPELQNVILEYGEIYEDYGATAWDAYDGYYGIPLKEFVDNGVDINKVGEYQVRYSFTDSNGNEAEEFRYVKIQDTVKPTITLNGESTIYLEYKETFYDEGAWFEDNYDPKIRLYATKVEFIDPVTLEGREVSQVDTSILGTYRLTYYKEDSSGNAPETAPTRTVVVRDKTPPVITLLGSNPYILKYGDEYIDPGFTVIDNYDGDITDNTDLVSVREVIGDTLGTYYVYYNAKDTHDNISEEVRRTVIIVDLVSPIIRFTESCPEIIYIEALTETYNSICNAPGTGFTVYDDYTPDINAIQGWVTIKGTVDTTTVGRYEITYNVSDRSGNKAVTKTRTVVVRDTTKPTITLKPNEDGDVDYYLEVFSEYHEYGWIASDIYDDFHDLEITVIVNEEIDVNRLNTYQVKYVARDTNGNESEPAYRYVTVRDTVPPEVIINGDLYVEVERGMGYNDLGAKAQDNYDGLIPRAEPTTEIPDGMKYGKFSIEYCAYDSSGNKGCASRIVNVIDTIAPTVYGAKDGEYYRNPFYIYYEPSFAGTDEVLTGWLNGQLISPPWYVSKEGHYELVVKDDAGNTTSMSFTLDMTPPVILGTNGREYINHDVNLHSDELLDSITYRFGNGGYITENEQNILLTDEGEYWVYATDMAGNVAEVVKFIIDKTPPEYVLMGVENGGITTGTVTLVTENDAVVSVNGEYIATSQVFTENGYYKVTIRDKAGNDVFIQFVINNRNPITISEKSVKYISQNNVIGKFLAPADASYPRGTGFIYAKPLVDGTFEYISGTLFSDEEYSKLTTGENIEFEPPALDKEEMAVAFIVTLDELNKFTTQTVEGDDDSTVVYTLAAIGIAALGGGFFYFFVIAKRKKEEEEEVDEEEVVEDDYY